MTDLHWDLSPISDAVTSGIRVEVLSRFSEQNSRPSQGEFVFEYTVRITNQGNDTVQLLSRHWIITDAVGRTREVEGPGVVGQTPVLHPGESHKYSSWCPLSTPSGMMRGTYRMRNQHGREFDIEIAPFALRSRQTVH
jgi:ApaG protein